MNFRITLYDLFVHHLQNFLVDIKGPGLAFLPVLAFEGGTRKNIPRFEVCTSLRSCLYVNSKDKVVRCLVYLWIHHVPMHHRMHIAGKLKIMIHTLSSELKI